MGRTGTLPEGVSGGGAAAGVSSSTGLGGEQGQLAGVGLLPLLAVPLPEELLDLALESLGEPGLLPQRLRLLADLPVRGGQVVGQCRVVISHDGIGAIGPPGARSAAIIQPASRAKRGRRRVAFRSMPPSMAASSAGVHSTPAAPGAGQR